MRDIDPAVNATIERLATEGRLLPAAAANLREWVTSGHLPAWAVASVAELVEAGAVEELNDRFYRFLEFGTGGMRGRTVGRVVTAAERGGAAEGAAPAHAAVGSNAMNDFTVVRATIGLFRYCRRYFEENGRAEVPRLVIAHDVRHFSRHFCELACSTWSRLGGTAFLYDGPRSTPQLSFSVRYLRATAGVVITASHNPPHDNGFKAYFEDGGQVVPPHDTGIVAEVARVTLAEVAPHLDVDLSRAQVLPASVDAAYAAVLDGLPMDPGAVRKAKLKAVFTSIHGTGRISTVPALTRLGVKVREVEAQAVPDGRFPTVKSPNPENAEALSAAVALAEETGADVVLGTDPDCDRMGVAVRGRDGRMHLLTGNQVGALLAEFRISGLKAAGLIPKRGSKNVALIKTFVTSPLQDAIGAAHGLKVINTLTGFKWIAAKLAGYEAKLRGVLAEAGLGIDYDATAFEVRADLLEKHSTFYAFGGEESYGYLPGDWVRDKDGNAACVLFCEFAAAVKADGRTVDEFLDGLYVKHGYYTEGAAQIYYEGAAGAEKIARILASYRKSPPKRMAGQRVTRFVDFGRKVIKDADGERIPAQDLYFVHLANGYSYAVRGSGTEPKIKFYLFARSDVPKPAALERVKAATAAELQALKAAVEGDAAGRA